MHKYTRVQWWVLKIMVQYLWVLLQGSWLVRISCLLVITDMTPKHKEKQIARGPDAACAGSVPIKFFSSLSLSRNWEDFVFHSQVSTNANSINQPKTSLLRYLQEQISRSVCHDSSFPSHFYVKPSCSNMTRNMYSNLKTLTVIHIYIPNTFCHSVYVLGLIFIYCRQKSINCTISWSHIIFSFIKYTPC